VRIAFEIRDNEQNVLRHFTVSEKFSDLPVALESIKLFGVEPNNLSIDDPETLVVEKILILPNQYGGSDETRLSCVLREKFMFDRQFGMFAPTDTKVMLILHDRNLDYDVGIADNISSDFADIALSIFHRYVAICLGIKSDAEFYDQLNTDFVDKAAEKIQNWWYEIIDRYPSYKNDRAVS
jgi:hypothetical protein